jgi:hypothetical protein
MCELVYSLGCGREDAEALLRVRVIILMVKLECNDIISFCPSNPSTPYMPENPS